MLGGGTFWPGFVHCYWIELVYFLGGYSGNGGEEVHCFKSSLLNVDVIYVGHCWKYCCSAV